MLASLEKRDETKVVSLFSSYVFTDLHAHDSVCSALRGVGLGRTLRSSDTYWPKQAEAVKKRYSMNETVPYSTAPRTEP